MVISLAVLVGAMHTHMYLTAVQAKSRSVEIRVEDGDSLSAVVHKLREHNVIANETVVSLWARLTGVEKKIQPGLYRFDLPLSAGEVIERLATGKGVFQSVTVPEGLTVKEIADLLGKMQIADPDKFLAASADPELHAFIGMGYDSVEGYLFPDTYHFTPATPPREIILQMAERFRKQSDPLLQRLNHGVQLTAHQIVTLASIIEKETGVEAERPLISAVFHNRLKMNMPLQSDPTVIYGIKNFNGNLTRKDLNRPGPYNTYRINGLPPGPICNPGLSSIKAAIHPADAPYLYFVSKNDGTHQFSENLAAHNRAVKIYQSGTQASSPKDQSATRRR